MKFTSALIALSTVLALAQAGVGEVVTGAPVVGPVVAGVAPSAAPATQLLTSTPVVGDVAKAALRRRDGPLGGVSAAEGLVDTATKTATGTLSGAPVLGGLTKLGQKRSNLERRGHKSHAKAVVRADVHLEATINLLVKLVNDVVANLDVKVHADLIAKIVAKIKADKRIKLKAGVDIDATVKLAVAKLLKLNLHAEGLLNVDVHVWIKGILDDLLKINVNVDIDVLIAHVKLALDAKIKNLALNLDLGLYPKAVANIKAQGLVNVKADIDADVKLGLDVDGLLKGVNVDVDLKANVCIDGLVHLG
ncbi:hypothetical protein EMPS_01058 [Entomortierella parvispora]|uniref:Uncharacterized protein n=1 Tax=Entomortierella parvispora TaxID=205924 RepID=A0A9P3H294_9FUNG|nr:hypothetical protein EMPS_01058 [Entomortierella parvispora]